MSHIEQMKSSLRLRGVSKCRCKIPGRPNYSEIENCFLVCNRKCDRFMNFDFVYLTCDDGYCRKENLCQRCRTKIKDLKIYYQHLAETDEKENVIGDYIRRRNRS